MTQRNNFETAELPPRAGSIGVTSTGQDPFANDSATSRVAARGRRGSRIPISLPITLRDQFGGQHQARTQSVMVRGAIVTSTSSLRVGHKLTIQNVKSGKSAECHVTAIEPGIAGSNTLELEFTGGQPDFWPVQFPSENSPAAMPPSTNLTSTDQLTLADDISAPTTTTSAVTSPPIRPRETELVSLADSVEQNFPAPMTAQRPVTPRTPPPTDSVAQFRAANRAAHRREQRMKTIYSIVSVLALAGLAFAGKSWLSHRPEAITQTQPVVQPTVVARTEPPTKPAPASTSPSNAVANVFAALKSTPSKVMAHIKLPGATTKATSEATEAAAPTDAPVAVEAKPLTQSRPVGDSQVIVRHGSSLASSRKASQDNGEEPLALPLTASVPANSQPKPDVLNAVVAQIPTQAAVLAPSAPVQQLSKGPTPAKLIFSVPAQYPAMARQLRTEGEVLLSLEIDTSGKVAEAKVISGAPMLRTAALDSVRRWKYEPATLGNKPVPSTQTVKVDFRLK